MADHWEAGTASDQRELVDTGVEGGPTSGRDGVDGRVHWMTTGNRGAVGGPTPTPGGLLEGNGLQERGTEEKVMAEAENYQGGTKEQVGGGRTGVPTYAVGGVCWSSTRKGVKWRATEDQR